MANYFIFGIGGTGSRVIRSFTMMLGAGFKPFKASDKVFPILIDYDTTNGDTKRARDLIDCYHKIHEAGFPQGVFNEERCNQVFFSTPILEMREANPAAQSGFTMKFGTENEQTFGNWIAMEQLRDHKKYTADLINSLYDDSEEGDNAELKLNMKVGFKGNPNIGSIVFHSLKDSHEFNDFASICQQGDKVIIVGSLFGGTGSSGIPELVQAIRTHPTPNVMNVDLSVVMVCPYFCFPSKDEKAVRSSIFNSKTKAALNFYEASGLNDMINAIYYVGDDRYSVYKYCEGGEGQRNKIHIVDLVSALSICHFAENTHESYNSTNRKVDGLGTKYYKYRISELSDDEIREKSGGEEQDKEDAHGLNFTNLIDKELDNMFFPLAAFALALKFFHDEVRCNKESVRELDWYKTLLLSSCFQDGKAVTTQKGDKNLDDLRICCSELIKMYNLFVEWNEEFKGHSTHALYLFNFDPEKELYDFIVEGSLKFENKTLGYKRITKLLDIEKDVAQCTTEAWNKMKAVTTFGVDSKYKAFMLLKSLTEGCREVFMSDKNDRSAKRRNYLSGKVIKV